MKITVKTLQQKQFQIDAEGSDTIADLKAKIQESQGHAVDGQKLIYSGKILSDAKTVESCEIKEKDFLVLMVSKPKAPSVSVTPKVSTPAAPSTPQPPAESSTPAQTTPAPTAPVQSDSTAPSDPTPQATTPSVAEQTRAFGDTSSFLSGDQLQSSINNMVEMGFPRDQVMLAMRASYNNPDRAVEYLMTGIPTHLAAETAPTPATNTPAVTTTTPPTGTTGQQPGSQNPAPTQPAPTTPTAPTTQPTAPTSTGPQNLFQLAQQAQQAGGGGTPPAGLRPGARTGAGGGGAATAAALEGLRSNPQMAQLRELIQQNPAMLQPLLQQLVQGNPQMAQLINQNPEALLNLLGGDEEGAGGEDDSHVINITAEENAAIGRLQALGFTRQQAAEVYLACDKNEELAANYLFEGGFDDD